MIEIITSKDNKYIKEVKKLEMAKYRKSLNKFYVEGLRNIKDYLNSNLNFSYALYSETLTDEAILGELECPKFCVEARLFNSLTETVSTQGLIVVIEKPEFSLDEIFESGKSLTLFDGILDPGNAGTLIRSARAAGLGGIILTEGTVDIYSPKVIRSGMGSISRLPIIKASNDAIFAGIEKFGYKIIILDMAGVAINNFTFPQKSIFVLGSEANGLSSFWRNVADFSLSIPMENDTESLNVAVAGSIVYFWRNLL